MISVIIDFKTKIVGCICNNDNRFIDPVDLDVVDGFKFNIAVGGIRDTDLRDEFKIVYSDKDGNKKLKPL